jgi:hypothetical protein
LSAGCKGIDTELCADLDRVGYVRSISVRNRKNASTEAATA